jgi:hypothetical protein
MRLDDNAPLLRKVARGSDRSFSAALWFIIDETLRGFFHQRKVKMSRSASNRRASVSVSFPDVHRGDIGCELSAH